MIFFLWCLAFATAARQPPVEPPKYPTIEAVSLYQATEVPLASVEYPVTEQTVPVIVGKDGAIRVVVSGGSGTVRASIELADGAVAVARGTATSTVEDRRVFVFRVDGDAIGPETTLLVRLADAAGKEIDRWPAKGTEWLDARSLGTLELAIVKVAYEGDSSGRMPDVSEARMGRWGAHLLRRYPFANVHLTVLEDPLVFSGDLRKTKAWSELLVALAAYRSAHAIGPDVLVYGVVNPARGYGSFHGTMAGLGSYPENGDAFRVAAGLGFTMDDDTTFAEVMAHELGHNLGLPHAPCNADGQVDPAYPYANGRIGVRGYDALADRWYDPAVYDLMSYCDPSWVSDWDFVRLFRGARGALGRSGASIEPEHLAAYDRGVQIRGFVKSAANKPLADVAVCALGSGACDTTDATGAWVLMTKDEWPVERLAFERTGWLPTVLTLSRPHAFDVYVESTDMWTDAEARHWAEATTIDLQRWGLVRIDVLDMAADASASGAVGARVVTELPHVYANARGEPDASLDAIGTRGRVVVAAPPGPVTLRIEGVVCPQGQVLAGPGEGAFTPDVIAGAVSELTVYCRRGAATP